MARTRVSKLAFNRGLVSRLGLARADIKRLALASEIQTNWVPRVLGSMMLRPGLGHLGESLDDLQAFHIPFVFSITDKAIVELTHGMMRVWVDDELIERVASATTISNGTFTVDLTGWTDADETGSTSAWDASRLSLIGDGTHYAIRRQQVTLLDPNSQEHGLRVIIARGPVSLRIGSSSGQADFLDVMLDAGEHSLTFSPSGATFWVEFKSNLERAVLVQSVAIEGAGDMEISTPWAEADLRKIRFDQSGDIIYITCDGGYQQRAIERRSGNSWSIVIYAPQDGPFLTQNVGATTITASALAGNITVSASQPIFDTRQIGAIFQHISAGQQVSRTITAQNIWTNPIRITGVDATRIFQVTITGLTATGSTVHLQRSLAEVGNWENVTTGGSPWTADVASLNFDDALDNSIIYYRIGINVGNYVAGTIVASLVSAIGHIIGVFRITAFTNNQSISAEVLTTLGSTSPTPDWAEGRWSTFRGFPTCVAFHEGRLCFAGRDNVQLSISDTFDGFDPEFEGDAAPIDRSIGSGPVDNINWLLSLQRLLLGGQGSEFSVRSSSLDEPLTTTNFNIKAASTQGSAPVASVKVDQTGIYVQRGGVRVYELAFGQDGVDYASTHLSALIPDIGEPGIVKMVVQRQPDTRIHYLRSDGTAAMLIFDKVEQVICWIEIDTDGEIEDAVVLPGDLGDEEDFVYYSVKRTINGTDKRFFEKWAFESECTGGTLNKQADCFITYSQSPSSTIAVAHLEGEDVVVWDNGKCLSDSDGEIATFTVTGGAITVTNAGDAYLATNGIVGLPYSAPFKSAKFVELMESLGGGILSRQNVKSLGLILADVHAQGLKYGPSLTESEMQDLPLVEGGAVVDPDAVREDYASEPITFPGEWSVNARLCLLAKAPRPCTVLAALMEVEFHG